MARFLFELAQPTDDLQLRQLLARISMPGKFSLQFKRPAGFFEAASVEGSNHQTIICRDTSSGSIVGMGSRSIRQRYVGGELTTVGYLSSLRLDERYRSLGLVARGFRYFRQLDREAPVDFYITTIAAGNSTAKRTLLGGRAGLPFYHRIGSFRTHVLSSQRYAFTRRAEWEIRKCSPRALPELVQFINASGSQLELLPQVSIDDFMRSGGTFRDLSMEKIFLAYQGAQLRGVFGAWDQGRFKQTNVQRYPLWMKVLRPTLNGWSRLRGDPELPWEGGTLDTVYGCLTVLYRNDPLCLQALLATYAKEHVGKPQRLLIGLDVRSPLCNALKDASYTYDTEVYVVSWNRERLPPVNLDRPFYLELGCL